MKFFAAWITAIACTLAGPAAHATPFTQVDAATTCEGLASLSSPEYCVLNGVITASDGQFLAAVLMDLAVLNGPASVGSTAQIVDHSPALDPGSRTAPLVIGAQLFVSIQVSFDAALDLAPREAGPGPFKGRPSNLAQIELALGGLMQDTPEEDKRIGQRALTRSRSYVSFALVNQAHVSAPRTLEEEPAEEDELIRQ